MSAGFKITSEKVLRTRAHKVNEETQVDNLKNSHRSFHFSHNPSIVFSFPYSRIIQLFPHHLKAKQSRSYKTKPIPSGTSLQHVLVLDFDFETDFENVTSTNVYLIQSRRDRLRAFTPQLLRTYSLKCLNLL